MLEKARGEAMQRDRERIWPLFDRYDVLMTPVMGGTALPLRNWEGRSAMRTMLGQVRFYAFTPAWNHLGNPAASVPAGFAADGMPLAVQLIGRYGDEGTLLSLAAQLEAERPWAGAHPPIS
jgi:amidase